MIAHELLAARLGPGAPRGGEDPEDPATVYAMQLAIRMEKTALPGRTDALEAAAAASLAVCLDPRADVPGAWRRALEEWYGHRIRKVVRRARGNRWHAVQGLPGVTVTVGTASVRAFIPGRVAEVYPEIARLQIAGTDLPPDLPDSPDNPACGQQPDAALRTHPALVAVDSSLGMTAGKAAAQVGHATMLLAANCPPERCARWRASGWRTAVRELPPHAVADLATHPGAVEVRDAGFTEVAPHSRTAVAILGS